MLQGTVGSNPHTQKVGGREKRWEDNNGTVKGEGKKGERQEERQTDTQSIVQADTTTAPNTTTMLTGPSACSLYISHPLSKRESKYPTLGGVSGNWISAH